MKRNLLVALLLSMALFSCRPKVVYVDRPVNTPSNSSNNEQVYQPAPGGSGYVTPPANNNQQYNNNGGQQLYNSNQTNNQESDQQYYANQQQVNYASSSYQTFYDELSPYGSWVNYQSYGYVWVPAQGEGFTPYSTNGSWTYTQYGWTWVSNYSWGWAPFHYGRWTMDPFYGWLWIPGNVWAPAQVTWGQYNGYYGWAPLGPNVNYYPGYRPAPQYWNFVPQAQMTQPNVNSYVVNHTNNSVIVANNINNVTIINNTNTFNSTSFSAGPPKESVENIVGHKIEPMTIAETNKPMLANQAIKGNNLSVYRPAISQSTATNAAPAHVVPLESVKTVNAAAVHGVLPGHTSVNTQPHTTIQPRPQNSMNFQEKPVQERPLQTRPVQEKPLQERPIETRPIQEKPVQQPAKNNNPNQNKPKPQPQPKPKPAPRPAAPERERK